MKKGYILNILAGVLEILLGFGFIATLVIARVGEESTIGSALMTPIFSFFTLIFKDEVFGAIIYTLYSMMFVYSVFAVCFIVYGSVTIAFMRREAGEYYKKKKSITFFLVSSCLAFAYCLVGFIIALSSGTFDGLTFALTVISGAALVLRAVGYVAYRRGMKLAPKSTEQDKYIPELNEYNDENVDLVTKLKRINTMKETGQITEKEYNDIKTKLLGENEK